MCTLFHTLKLHAFLLAGVGTIIKFRDSPLKKLIRFPLLLRWIGIRRCRRHNRPGNTSCGSDRPLLLFPCLLLEKVVKVVMGLLPIGFTYRRPQSRLHALSERFVGRVASFVLL